MSWAAHDLEPYVIQRHTRIKVAFVPLLIGSYSPDLMSKWFVYGIHLGGWRLKASDPATFHRGWPGVGFTHSLLYGVVVCFIFWRLFGSKTWGISFLIGQWAHALTDTGDTVGTMLFFPWTLHVHFGAWAYAGQTGRFTDAAAYFSGPGAVWDAFWIVYGLFCWRVITRDYFERHVFPEDSFWKKLNRVLPKSALLVTYRAAFFYGTSRWICVDALGPRGPPLSIRPLLGRPALGKRGAFGPLHVAGRQCCAGRRHRRSLLLRGMDSPRQETRRDQRRLVMEVDAMGKG